MPFDSVDWREEPPERAASPTTEVVCWAIIYAAIAFATVAMTAYFVCPVAQL